MSTPSTHRIVPNAQFYRRVFSESLSRREGNGAVHSGLLGGAEVTMQLWQPKPSLSSSLCYHFLNVTHVCTGV